jgi:hypothetical protein
MELQDRSKLLASLARISTDQSVLLFSTLQTGGLGLNLTMFQAVIICDTVFNPYVQTQAKKRVHRIGQSHPVTCVTLMSDTSVEHAMVQLQKRKLDLGETLVEKDIHKINESDEYKPILGYEAMDSVFRNIISESKGNNGGVAVETTTKKRPPSSSSSSTPSSPKKQMKFIGLYTGVPNQT